MRASIIHFNISPVKLEKFHAAVLAVMEAEMVWQITLGFALQGDLQKYAVLWSC